MQPYVEPTEVPRKNVSPILAIIFAILGVAAVFLLLPSSRKQRTSRARTELATDFKAPPASTFQGLANASVVAGESIKKPDFSRRGLLFVLAPSPGKSIDSQLASDLLSPARTSSYGLSLAANEILFAPDPKCPGWTLVAENLYYAAMRHQPTAPILIIAQQMSIGPTGANMTKLKSMWAKVPEPDQRTIDEMIDQNRAALKGLAGSHRFFHGSNGDFYEIPPSRAVYEFTYLYEEVNPSHQAAE